MSQIIWDKIGERVFQTGVDRGVLYLLDGTFAPWNGLISIEEAPQTEKKSFYLDGVKYLEQITPGDYAGKLKAFTYPEEFNRAMGIVSVASGLEYHDQPPEMFNLTYRTLMGDDVSGVDSGYVIHLLYNLVADPEGVTHETLGDSPAPAEFVFGLSGIPPKITGYRPTVHISLDSKRTLPQVLGPIEDILYGSSTTNPRFPSINELNTLFDALTSLIVVDNGDGTWTAVDLGDNYVTMINSTTFQLTDVNATYLDDDTYEVSNTHPD